MRREIPFSTSFQPGDWIAEHGNPRLFGKIKKRCWLGIVPAYQLENELYILDIHAKGLSEMDDNGLFRITEEMLQQFDDALKSKFDREFAQRLQPLLDRIAALEEQVKSLQDKVEPNPPTLYTVGDRD